jgi:hypothetical protein
MKKIITTILMTVVAVHFALGQSLLCTYKGGYFIRDGNKWYEYRPKDKDGIWNEYTQNSSDANYYYIENSSVKLSIPKEDKIKKIWIYKNNNWEVIYSVIRIYDYCPVKSNNIFAYNNGFFIKSGSKWQEYDPNQKKTGALDNFEQYKEDDNYYYIKNNRIDLAIPRKGDSSFYMDRNGWVKLYAVSALYDRQSPNAQSGYNSSSENVKQSNKNALSKNTNRSNNGNQQQKKEAASPDYLDVLHKYSQYDKIKEDFGTITSSVKEEYEQQTVYRFYYDSGWEKILSVKKNKCMACHGDGKLHNWYFPFPPPSNVCGRCNGLGIELPTVMARKYPSPYIYLENGEKMYRNDGGGVNSGNSSYDSKESNASSNSSSSSLRRSVCSYCGGGGGCRSCNGRGCKYNSYSHHEDTCPSCNGSGRCFNCRGTGRL